MSRAGVHTVVLYGFVIGAIVVAAALLARKPRDRRRPRLWPIWATWPFGALAVFETLQLRAAGHLVVEWLLPGLVCAAVTAYGGPPRAIAWWRRVLVVAACALYLDGTSLLGRDYVTRPTALAPGARVEPHWYTPLTGLQRVVRGPRAHAHAPAR